MNWGGYSPERRLFDAVRAEGTEWQTGALCVDSDFDFIPDADGYYATDARSLGAFLQGRAEAAWILG